MVRAKQRIPKSNNGQGTTPGFYTGFDTNNANEARAYRAAKRIAGTKHGGRKQLLVAIFNALEDYYSVNGRDMTPEQALSAMLMLGQRLVPQAGQNMNPIIQPDSLPEIVLQTAKKADAVEQSNAFLKARAGMFKLK